MNHKHIFFVRKVVERCSHIGRTKQMEYFYDGILLLYPEEEGIYDGYQMHK